MPVCNTYAFAQHSNQSTSFSIACGLAQRPEATAIVKLSPDCKVIWPI